MNLIELLQSFTRRFGFDLVPFTAAQHALPRRQRLLEHAGIDLVFDVGANVGQFARELRAAGYRGRIVSFEPLADAFKRLQAAARGDTSWEVLNLALGDVCGARSIHVAANSESSSLRTMLPLHLEAAPYAQFKGRQTVSVQTLDAVFAEVRGAAERIWLKVDTQGYEAQVLQGAATSLPHIDVVQMEMSLAPLYEGQALFEELYAEMRRHGFMLVGVENNFGDERTGHLLQIDGIFRRVA